MSRPRWRVIGGAHELVLTAWGAELDGLRERLHPAEAHRLLDVMLALEPPWSLAYGAIEEAARYVERRHPSAISTRVRDARAVVREALARGLLSAWKGNPRLAAVPLPEQLSDEEAQRIPLASALIARSWIAIRLLDEEARPLAGARYRIKLPLEDWLEGHLDGNGRAHHLCREYGVAKVEFPDFDESEWYEELVGEKPEPPPPDHYVAIRLLDDEGRPMGGARYRLKTPRGGWVEGTLDNDGRARVEQINEGVCKVEFPDFDESEWYEALATEKPEPPPPDHYVAIKLLDDEGRPMGGARYRVKVPRGGWIEGTLDGDGRARVEPIYEGVCKVEFPDFDESEWYAGEPLAPPLEPLPPLHSVTFALLDDEGQPMRGARYRFKSPGGGWIEGTLDDEGRANITQINEGVCKVEFPDFDEAELVSA